MFWLQDPKDGSCLGPYGFAACNEATVWVLADRREGKALVSVFEGDDSAMCL